MTTPEEKACVFWNFLNSLQQPVDIISLISSSSSFSNDEFAILKFCMRTLATLLEFSPPPASPSDKDPVRIGVIQFDAQAYIVCNLESDPVTYTTAVVSMRQKRGSTNAGAGFKTCLNLFRRQHRNASRAILFFTDGDVKAAGNVVPYLVKNGIQILSLGVGLSENHKYSVVNLSNQVILVQNFTEMQNIISKLYSIPIVPPKLYMITRSSKKASLEVIYPGVFDCVEVNLLEDGQNEWKTLPTASTPIYFIEALAPNKLYKVIARVRTQIKAWTKGSEAIRFRTLPENPETAILKSSSLPSVTNELISKINNYITSPQWKLHGVTQVNVSLFGSGGSGKSAYFNSIYSVLRGQYEEVQKHKSSTMPVTLTINKLFLTNKSIRLWDTYGWTSANSSYEREFMFLLEGAIPDGFKEGDEILGKLINPQIVDKVHAIVVIYEMPAVPDESNMRALKRFYNKMCDKNLQPIVVLTKVDLIITEADRLSDVYDSGVIDVYISQFCKACTIPRANVFPVVNFRGAWQERDFVAEKLLLNSFYVALRYAQAKVESLLEQRVVVYDKSDPTNPRQVAIVDSGSWDDNIQLLVERIQREPGLEEFQIYHKGSSTVVQKLSYPITKFMACASPTSHGYWELFGAMPIKPKLVLRACSSTEVTFDVIFSDVFDLAEVKILEDGSNYWNTLPISSSSSYSVEGLVPNKQYKLTASVRTLSRIWSPTVALLIRTLAENPETTILKSPSLSDTCASMVDAINKYSIPSDWEQIGISQLNIALMGHTYGGKSAYFDSIYSILRGKYTTIQKSEVGTHKVCKMQLPKECICLWDTYGWTFALSSYEHVLQPLLEGTIPDGYQEHGSFTKTKFMPKINDKVHSVIVVYEMTSVMTESDMKTLKHFYDKICLMNLQPVVVLTKVDLVLDADLEDGLSDVFNSTIIYNKISEFCNSSSIPRANVFPVVNITEGWQDRDYVKEKLLLNSFYAALKFAQTKVTLLLEEKLVVYDKLSADHKRVAIVDRGCVDDSIQTVLEQIQRVSGLEKFQVYLKETSTIVPPQDCNSTRFMACATLTSHGYWELFGVSRILQPKREVGIFTSDPRNSTSKSIGAVQISPSAMLAELRIMITDEVEVPADYKKFYFIRASGCQQISEQEETAVTVSDIIVTYDLTLCDVVAKDLVGVQITLQGKDIIITTLKKTAGFALRTYGYLLSKIQK